jgi:hypothetical protein
VRREPAPFGEWLARRPRQANDDLAMPMKAGFFLSLAPLLIALAVLGGLRLAGAYAGVIAVAAVGLALRGRAGAAAFFPLYACLFAPVWVLERSLSVYWALSRRLWGADPGASRVAVADGASKARAASGE